MSVLKRPRQPILMALAVAIGTPQIAAADDAPAQRPETLQTEGVAIDQQLGAQVPLDVTFRDEQGELVQIGQLLSRNSQKPVVLNLVYFECPMLCNLAMDGLIRSLRVLPYGVGDELTVITVSFDPREGPELAAAAKRTALQRYGRPRANEHWHFLTGERAEIDRLCRSVGFEYRWDPTRGQYAHAAGIIVLTPEGVVSRYLLGIEYAPRDLRLSLVEAGDGQIGSLTDQVLLLCYQYDPLTGRYGLLIRRVLRTGGIATVGLLAASIGWMLWNERRRGRTRALTPDHPTSKTPHSAARERLTDHAD